MIWKFKKYRLLVVLVFLLWLLLSACSQKTLSIGYSASLTGTNSELGVIGRNGLMLAVDTVNSTGGVNGQEVNLIIKDDKNNPQTALTVDQELYDAGVNFIIGHMTSNMAEHSLPFINEHDLLMISPTMSSQTLSKRDDHLLRVVSSNEAEIEFMAKTIKQAGNYKKIAIIYEAQNEAYTLTSKSILISLLQENGSSIIKDLPFESGNNPPYWDIANEILDSEADCIVILASSFDAALFCQQFYKLGMNKPLFLPTWAMNNNLIIQGGPAVEGIHISSLFDPNSEDPNYLKFKENYQDKYGDLPSFSAVYTYEAAMILFDAIETSQTTDPAVIKKTILDTKTYQGLQNEISIDRFGDATRKIYNYTIKNRQFEKGDE